MRPKNNLKYVAMPAMGRCDECDEKGPLDSMSKTHSHDWYWMAEAYNDGERWDYYECEECGETKVEKTKLDFPIETPENSNPVAWGSMQ